MNIEAENKIMSIYLQAVREMLLKGKALKPGLLFAAGDRRTPDNPLQVAMAAKASGDDIVHLGFERNDGEYRFVELTLYMPRDEGTYIVSNCQLYMDSRNSRAVILPPIGRKGSFRTMASEIVRLNRVPADRDKGVARANERLQALAIQLENSPGPSSARAA